MRLSLAVQHHPSRAELLPNLLRGVAPLPTAVVCDPTPEEPPSAWRCYRRCLEETPAWATHHAVVQDDAILCRNFAAALERIVAACPCSLLVLCVCRNAHRLAAEVGFALARGDRWAGLPLSGSPIWIPAVAVVWPTSLIPAALRYVDDQNWPPAFTADDEIIGRASRALDLPVCVTVPSLVGHDNETPSVIRSHRQDDPGRETAAFIGDADPLALTWG